MTSHRNWYIYSISSVKKKFTGSERQVIFTTLIDSFVKNKTIYNFFNAINNLKLIKLCLHEVRKYELNTNNRT